jgi:hypothetical protein
MTYRQQNQILRRRRAARRQQRHRRGVLLLVVLSMLVLFMMVGTAFLMTSDMYRKGSKAAAKEGRVGNPPRELLDRALYQLLRDTNNQFSVVRYHSLLRDMYGTDGFEATVYRPATVNLSSSAGQATRYAGATSAKPLGPTQGQLIDIYIRPEVLAGNGVAEPHHVIKLQRDIDNLPQLHMLPLINGYYNGTLLTFTSGPARGQSARVVEYTYGPIGNSNEYLYRLRIMAVPRSDGQNLEIDPDRNPEIKDLVGHSFIVNGRPYNGTGVGYDPTSTAGTPRLSMLDARFSPPYDVPVALAPNAVTYNGAWNYNRTVPYAGHFSGLGGCDESYDAPDFQNMFLAHETVMPVAQGTWWDANGQRRSMNSFDLAQFVRFDLENVPIPSFHRMALINYWYTRLAQEIAGGNNVTNDHIQAVLHPYDANGNPHSALSPEQAAMTTALKRKIMMRPLQEDHPDFDGSNPQSRNTPSWEIVGPWDVDNDNDGVPDSIFVDLGDPVQQAEDGTLYKPLYAIKIIDLDSRLNVNAHGTAEHVVPPVFDQFANVLAGTPPAVPTDRVSNDQMPHGSGYGTPEISLRPVFPAPYNQLPGNRVEYSLNNGLRDPAAQIDDYAALLAGRITADGLTIGGRYGFFDPSLPAFQATPGINDQYAPNNNSVTGDNARPDPLAQLKFFDYPLSIADSARSFGSPPDVMGRYASGLNHYGQPVRELYFDSNPNVPQAPNHLLANSPYELNLNHTSRRGIWDLPQHGSFAATTDLATASTLASDDAPFATAELERILRAHDADAGTIPSRLWEVVDAFDPDKLIYNSQISSSSVPLAVAQQQAAINRRLVTTDSHDLPVPGGNMGTRLVLGADGIRGPNPQTGINDDYENLMGGQPVPLGAGILDLLRYRMQYERFRRGLPLLSLLQLNVLSQNLLAPEVVAGHRMDINRPFGNGQDDNNNGVVDEPQEVFSGERLWNPNDSGGSLSLSTASSQLRLAALAQTGGVPFDYTNGVDVDGKRSDVDHNNDGNIDLVDAQIAKQLDAQLARQLYARHLYVLMMLLVDERYLATPDIMEDPDQQNSLVLASPNDKLLVTATQKLIEHELPGADENQTLLLAKKWVLRKLTARRIAQWAINCADFRDPDAIMTPFEYDENPFDGWGVTIEINGSEIVVPIDGNVETNENWGLAEDLGPSFPTFPYWYWQLQPNGSAQRVENPKRGLPDFQGTYPDATVENTTRDVVWGAERPELLITETFAYHDRRCSDDEGEKKDKSQPLLDGKNHDVLEPPGADTDDDIEPDDDLDQQYKPRGTLFVELYNPWDTGGQVPKEFYVNPNTGTPYIDPNTGNPDPGVLLDRLSNPNPNSPVPQSPVWRMVVVKDPLSGRLTIQKNAAIQPRSFDIDGHATPSMRNAERQIYFHHDPDRNAGLSLRIPKVLEQKELPVPGRVRREWPTAAQYFVTSNYKKPLAPIKPGRYAVIGPSGIPMVKTKGERNKEGSGDRYRPAPPVAGEDPTHFVNPISRLVTTATQGNQQPDRDHTGNIQKTRRIELIPDPNPDRQQLLVGDNGGPEFVPQPGTDNYVNATSGEWVSTRLTLPCVAIPIEGLNISEPVEGYPSILYHRLYSQVHREPFTYAASRRNWTKRGNQIPLNRDGESKYEHSYDRPFDLEFDLVRNGTVPNYRSLHLQRLANPLLPWNPRPFDELPIISRDPTENSQEKDFIHPDYDPRLPVNPYMTVDSMSVDLTAFNGMNSSPATLASFPTGKDPDTDQPITDAALLQGDYLAPLSAEEVLAAPDHVLSAFLDLLKDNGIVGNTPSVPAFRRKNPTEIKAHLERLERKRNGHVDYRGELLDSNDGQWGWHRLKRFLPTTRQISYESKSDQFIGTKTATFKQRMHLKSLERGAHHLWLTENNTGDAGENEGWYLDPEWEPRLLWKQERPNGMVVYGDPTNPQRARKFSELTNVLNRDLLRNRMSGNELTQREQNRNEQILKNLVADNGGSRSPDHVFDFVMEHTLGFINESYAPDLNIPFQPPAGQLLSAVRQQSQVGWGAPEIDVHAKDKLPLDRDGDVAIDFQPRPKQTHASTESIENDYREKFELDRLAWFNPVLARSLADKFRISSVNEMLRTAELGGCTFPALAWNDRPYVSQMELLQVPASSSSLLLRDYSVIGRGLAVPYDGDGYDEAINALELQDPLQRRRRQQGFFGHLLNFMQSSHFPTGNDSQIPTEVFQTSGAPHHYRLLEFVHVPSRFVQTETLLDPVESSGLGSGPNSAPLVQTAVPLGEAATDPRLNLQPPYNKVSNYREPGRVNLNTVSSRRTAGELNGLPPRIWSEVYDGIMHRLQGGEPTSSGGPGGHFGPAWRDVVLSRRGYATSFEGKINGRPDVLASGLNPDFPTFFANPFRSPDAGELVPLPQMVQLGVNASLLRAHPFHMGEDLSWGDNQNFDSIIGSHVWLNNFGKTTTAGEGDDPICVRKDSAIPNIFDEGAPRSLLPLFSESFSEPHVDAERNPNFFFQPLTRLGNLTTTRSGVFAVWITVAYFEVEPAPSWDDPNTGPAIQAKFGSDRTLYDQVYPEGYQLGQEVGIETGDTRRHRGFYIVDRTLPVGFKPGEDLNVQNMIRLRRRIE